MKQIRDRFTNTVPTRQRRYQLRMQNRGRCTTCGRVADRDRSVCQQHWVERNLTQLHAIPVRRFGNKRLREFRAEVAAWIVGRIRAVRNGHVKPAAEIDSIYPLIEEALPCLSEELSRKQTAIMARAVFRWERA